MKRYYKYILSILAVVGIVGCMELVSLIHPDSAPVNSEIEVVANIKVKLDVGPRTTLVCGILAPVSWNLAQNATITYSSADMPSGAISGEPMRVATDADVAPDGKPWAQTMNEKLGYRGNYEPVEWVAFIAVNPQTWNQNDSFSGTVNIKFKTGGENIKTKLSYFIGNALDGVNNDPQYYLIADKLFETTGGSNPTIDYTTPKICTITPKYYTWEDIVAFNFDATIKVDNNDSALKGATEVYFQAEATYDNGQKTSTVTEISPKTKMVKKDTDKWIIYMYPHEFFNIPAGTKIEKIAFYMVNADKTVVVKLPDGTDFSIGEHDK